MPENTQQPNQRPLGLTTNRAAGAKAPAAALRASNRSVTADNPAGLIDVPKIVSTTDPATAAKPPKKKPVPVTTRVPDEAFNKRLRGAYLATGRIQGLTYNAWLVSIFDEALSRIEHEHNSGKEFSASDEAFAAGRPFVN